LGDVVCWNLVRWQLAHGMGVPANLPPAWQEAQGVVECLPVSGKRVRALWSKLAGVHPAVVWQVSHAVGNPEAVWFGLVVFWKLARWQPEHWAAVPAYRPPT
jgi:hypothetical protein